jgi:hypothetical protein
MARYFHGGPNAVDPEREAQLGIDEKDMDTRRKNAIDNHKLTSPSRDALFAEMVDGEQKLFLRVPEAYWRYNRIQFAGGTAVQVVPDSTRVEWQKGSTTLALPGVGFWVIPPGGYIDVDVPAATVRSIAPHLLTEGEALERGIAQPAASPVRKAK